MTTDETFGLCDLVARCDGCERETRGPILAALSMGDYALLCTRCVRLLARRSTVVAGRPGPERWN